MTMSPSRTASCVTWPGIVAEMSTFFCAWTLPLAVTLACRSSCPTTAVCTGVGFGPRFSAATPPPAPARTTTLPTTHKTFFLLIATPVMGFT